MRLEKYTCRYMSTDLFPNPKANSVQQTPRRYLASSNHIVNWLPTLSRKTLRFMLPRACKRPLQLRPHFPSKHHAHLAIDVLFAIRKHAPKKRGIPLPQLIGIIPHSLVQQLTSYLTRISGLYTLRHNQLSMPKAFKPPPQLYHPPPAIQGSCKQTLHRAHGSYVA